MTRAGTDLTTEIRHQSLLHRQELNPLLLHRPELLKLQFQKTKTRILN